MPTEFLQAMIGAIMAYVPPGADPKSSEWSFVPDLGKLVYQRFEQVNFVMRLLSEVGNNGRYLNAPAIDCRATLKQMDPISALDQVTYGLTKIPSPQFAGERWDVNRPMHIPGGASAAFATATVLCRFAPIQADRRFNSAQLFLEVRAELSDRINLTLRFQDQLGWLFDQAIHQVNTTIRAVHTALGEYGSLIDGLSLVSDAPKGQEAVNRLEQSDDPYVAR